MAPRVQRVSGERSRLDVVTLQGDGRSCGLRWNPQDGMRQTNPEKQEQVPVCRGKGGAEGG